MTQLKEKLRVDQWRDKEATRDAVRQAIYDFLWNETTGLPVECFPEKDVAVKTDEIFRHIYRAYPPYLRPTSVPMQQYDLLNGSKHLNWKSGSLSTDTPPSTPTFSSSSLFPNY